jgi:hypothetical protein
MKSGMNVVMAVLNVIVATHHQKDIVKIAIAQKCVNQGVNVIKDTHVIIVLDTVFSRNNVLKVHGALIMKHLWIVWCLVKSPNVFRMMTVATLLVLTLATVDVCVMTDLCVIETDFVLMVMNVRLSYAMQMIPTRTMARFAVKFIAVMVISVDTKCNQHQRVQQIPLQNVILDVAVSLVLHLMHPKISVYM